MADVLKKATDRSKADADRYCVLHAIKDSGESVWGPRKQDAYYFIAGKVKNIPDAVRDSLKAIMMEYGHLSEEEALNYIKKMDQRYQAETWS